MNKRKKAINIRDCSDEQRESILALLQGQNINLPEKIRFAEPISSEVEQMNFTEDKPWLLYSPLKKMWVFDVEPENRAEGYAICNFWQFRIGF